MTTQSLLTKIPENTSFLQPTKFTLVFPTLPFLRYFGQTATVPGISTSPVSVETPFSNTWRHGDKLVYSELSVNAIIDEDMRLWEETYNWLVALTKPQSFTQYIRYHNKKEMVYHDAILTINTNANNPNIRFKFTNLHPISLGGVNFNVSDNANTTLTADIIFRYDYFELLRL
jgi:hypothetical protein